MNKRGDFLDIFTTIAGIIVVAMMLTTFWYLFAFSSNQKHTQKIIETKLQEEKLTLHNLLKTPIEISLKEDGALQQGNIADFIIFSYKKNDFEEFKKITKKKLDQLFIDTKCTWTLTIIDDKRIVTSFGRFDNGFVEDENYKPNIKTANVTIPVDNKKYLMVYYKNNLLDHEYGNC